MLDLSLDRKDVPSPRELPAWNPEAFVDALKAINPDLNWRAVVEGLDDANCIVSNFTGFVLLLRIHRRASKVLFVLHACTPHVSLLFY